jgi:hypothetical protein
MRRLLLTLGLLTAASGAVASTDLSGANSSVFRQSSLAGDWAGPPASFKTIPFDAASADATSADDLSAVIDDALRAGTKVAAPAVVKNDRFSWVFLLIAFAGLTAAFAGRRSGGSGLISG